MFMINKKKGTVFIEVESVHALSGFHIITSHSTISTSNSCLLPLIYILRHEAHFT